MDQVHQQHQQQPDVPQLVLQDQLTLAVLEEIISTLRMKGEIYVCLRGQTIVPSLAELVNSTRVKASTEHMAGALKESR